jgi:hypothetical protein
MLISTALLLDSIIRNSVCTPAKLPCRRVEVGYDNNIVNNKIKKNLRFLSDCETIYLDGTFSYCTKFFVQLFSIDGVKNEQYVPLVFCLLNDKRTETYEKCFKSLPFTTPLNELGKKGLFLDVDFIYLKRGGEKCKNWVSLKTINLITRLGNS